MMATPHGPRPSSPPPPPFVGMPVWASASPSSARAGVLRQPCHKILRSQGGGGGARTVTPARARRPQNRTLIGRLENLLAALPQKGGQEGGVSLLYADSAFLPDDMLQFLAEDPDDGGTMLSCCLAYVDESIQ